MSRERRTYARVVEVNHLCSGSDGRFEFFRVEGLVIARYSCGIV